MKPLKINTTIGIIGVEIISKTKTNNETKYEITVSGTARAYKIPNVIVFCEDPFAEQMIKYALAYNDINIGSFKIIKCGVWRNILKTLTGFLIYENELIKSGNEKALKAVGVIDGDISEHEIKSNINKTYHGNFPPDDLAYITDEITQHTASFSLNQDSIKLPENSTGRPEFNLKIMLDEITDDMIDKYHKEDILKHEDWLSKAKDDNARMNISRQLDDIKRKSDETKEIILISRSIESIQLPQNEGKKYDYHNYIDIFRERLLEKHFREYDYKREVDLIIYRIISTYNKERWEEYISPVIKVLCFARNEQTKRFSHHSFDNKHLDKHLD